MNKTNRIRLYFVLFALLAILGYTIGHRLFKVQSQKPFNQTQAKEEKSVATKEEEPATESMHVVKKGKYTLKVEDGRLTVYLSDESTVYLYTGIQMLNLPKEVQQDIENGRWFQSTEELYDFLENYAS